MLRFVLFMIGCGALFLITLKFLNLDTSLGFYWCNIYVFVFGLPLVKSLVVLMAEPGLLPVWELMPTVVEITWLPTALVFEILEFNL
jgi:hypothetical protein